MPDKGRVEQWWAKCDWSSSKSLFNFDPARRYMLKCLGGSVGSDRLADDWFDKWRTSKYLQGRMPVNRCLSICCGRGEKDRVLAKLGVFKHCVGVDLSRGAIEKARSAAVADGLANLEYRAADINDIELEENAYDLVYASGALHHIRNLEHVIGQIRRTLKPGGLLLSDEYVGPRFNDFSQRHREIINSAIHLIPRRLRYASEDLVVPAFFRVSRPRRVAYEIGRLIFLRPSSINFELHQVNGAGGRLMAAAEWVTGLAAKLRTPNRQFHFGKVWDSSPKAIEALDPSEGVRSDEIISIVRRVFGSEVEIRYFNGSVLHFALDRKFFDRFDEASSADRGIFELLVQLEETMIRCGEIPPILAHIAAHKR